METIKSDTSREKIKSRMLKNAVQLWGHQPTDVDSYDPLVSMLMGACATEFEKIYHEIYSSQARLLERLAQLLTPEINKGPETAHAVMHLRSVEASAVINQEAQFYTKKSGKNNVTQEEFVDIYFSPVQDTTVINGEIKYIVSDSAVYEMNGIIQKERLFSSAHKSTNSKTTLWIGLDIDKSVESLEGLSFYFDWFNNPDRDSYYKLLPFSRWFVNGSKINIHVGLPDKEASEENMLSREYDVLYKQEEKIIAFYNHAFVTIKNNPEGQLLNESKIGYPAEFKKLFSEKELEKLKEGMVWIQINFPPSSPPEVIDEISCMINCFPVINRKLNEIIFRLQTDRINIIPLIANNSLFFSMNKVRTDTGVDYMASSSIKDVQKTNSNTYVLTQGNLERFDSRDAADYLSHLLSLIGNETLAFSAYGQEFVSSSLKEINQIIASLNQKISRNETTSGPVNYLVIKPANAKNIFIEFWSTNGEAGNNIRSGTSLIPYSNYNTDNASALLVSGSSGGKNYLNPQETLDAYKQSLMTRERVVTKEDIRAVCRKELGRQISEIKVENGWAIDPDEKKGFIKTIDVAISCAEGTDKTREEWNTVCGTLKTILELKSAGFTPFRVFIKE